MNEKEREAFLKWSNEVDAQCRADLSNIPWEPNRRVVSREELKALNLVDNEFFLYDTVPVTLLMEDLRRIFK